MREIPNSITPAQSRMARAALHWTVQQLADLTELAANTVLAFEAGRSVRGSTAFRIQSVFEAHGVRFTALPNDRIGVETRSVVPAP